MQRIEEIQQAHGLKQHMWRRPNNTYLQIHTAHANCHNTTEAEAQNEGNVTTTRLTEH